MNEYIVWQCYEHAKLDEGDRDKLADVIWFMKGFEFSGKSPFDEGHYRSMEKILSVIKEKIDVDNEMKTHRQ